MVSNIDSTRLGWPSETHVGTGSTVAVEARPRPPAIDDGDVRLSLSETARRLSGASISAGETASRRLPPEPARLDEPAPSARSAIREAAGDEPDEIARAGRDRDGSTGSRAAYHAPAPREVGRRLSIRV